MLLASLPATACDHLHRILHGPCPPSVLSEPRTDATDRSPGTGPAGGERLLHHLRLMGQALPAPGRIFDDPAVLAAVHAWAAVTDPSLCLAALVHHTLCLGSMAQLTEKPEHLGPRMRALTSGHSKGVYLITEAGRANSHLATRTRAWFDPDSSEFVLHTPDAEAAKFGSAGTVDVPQTAVVLARLVTDGADRGVFAFVVDLTADDGPLPGIEISSPIGLGALPLDYVLVRFQHVRVPYAHWLADGAAIGADDVFHDPAGSAERRLQRTLRVGQGLWALMPAVAAATARQSAVQAVNYAQQRRTQGSLAPDVPLLDYRTQQRAVLGALADAFALTCASHGARALWARSLAAGSRPEDEATTMGFTPWAAISRPLAAYKVASVRLAARITAECQRRCGFSGHLDVNRLAAYQGFHHAFDAAGGDSQLILYDIGRALAEESGTAPVPADGATDTSAGPPPTAPSWWPTIVRGHQDKLTAHLADRLRAQAPASPFDAWNPLLEDAGLLGELYADALIAADVAHVLGEVRDESLHAVLRPLAALHGAMAARRWSASLLAHATLRPADVHALPDVIDHLCDVLRPHLPLLTKAFIHGDATPTPLAASDYNTALWATLTWTRGATA
ncbi:acyl-CoA dehydrogenase [Streptomyces acidicola]|uniref:acyl-CoA dehydrogenase family protein n=1 Tax=Streptomyces acidicola TaxID=2596892 RepID=UPI003796D2A5